MNTTQVAPPAYSGLASSAATAKAAEAQPDKQKVSSDFETFLRMLTVQMQNQDPLNPVDSSDYAVQLATFSSVEQQVLTNDLLRAMNGQLAGGSLGQLAGWVGMEALARVPVAFDGDAVDLRPDFAAQADSAKLVVRDANGDVVAREPLALSQESVQWTGEDENGLPVAPGVYRFEIESYRSGTLIDTKTAQAYSAIREARISGDTVLLRLSDGSEVESALVAGVKAPD